MFKIKYSFQKCGKIRPKAFSFLDNLNWIHCSKITLLPREYLGSGVNVLTNGLKILDTTKADMFELKFS